MSKFCEVCMKDVQSKNWARHIKSKKHLEKGGVKKEVVLKKEEEEEDKWEDPMDLEVINLLDFKENEVKEEVLEVKKEESLEVKYEMKLLDEKKRGRMEEEIIRLLGENDSITLKEDMKFREISDELIRRIKNMGDQELMARIKYIKLQKTKKLRNKFYDTFKDGVGFSFNNGIKYLFGLDDEFVKEQEEHPEVVEGLLSVNTYLPSSFKLIIDEIMGYPWMLSFGITGINIFKSINRLGFDFMEEEDEDCEEIKEAKVLYNDSKKEEKEFKKEKEVKKNISFNKKEKEVQKRGIVLPPRPVNMSDTEWESILDNVLNN